MEIENTLLAIQVQKTCMRNTNAIDNYKCFNNCYIYPYRKKYICVLVLKSHVTKCDDDDRSKTKTKHPLMISMTTIRQNMNRANYFDNVRHAPQTLMSPREKKTTIATLDAEHKA